MTTPDTRAALHRAVFSEDDDAQALTEIRAELEDLRRRVAERFPNAGANVRVSLYRASLGTARAAVAAGGVQHSSDRFSWSVIAEESSAEVVVFDAVPVNRAAEVLGKDSVMP